MEYIKMNGSGSNKIVPVDDLNINGESLSNLVPGYRQLSVSGRGIIGEEVETATVPARAGVWLNYTKAPPRPLTIKYQLSADSSNELRERFNQLNKVLRDTKDNKTLDITFNDEPDWHYYGVLRGANDFEENKLSIVSDFELFCPDPYAYGVLQSGSVIRLKYANEVLPKSIRLISQGTNNIYISNGRDRLVLNGSYGSYQIITIDYRPEQIVVLRDRVDVTTDLAQFSYPESFYLRDGDRIRVTGASLSKVEWRDRKL